MNSRFSQQNRNSDRARSYSPDNSRLSSRRRGDFQAGPREGYESGGYGPTGGHESGGYRTGLEASWEDDNYSISGRYDGPYDRENDYVPSRRRSERAGVRSENHYDRYGSSINTPSEQGIDNYQWGPSFQDQEFDFDRYSEQEPRMTGRGLGGNEGINDGNRSKDWRTSRGGGYYGQGNSGSQSSYSSGNPSFTGKGPKGYRRSDDRICEMACDALTDDPRVDASEIEVKVEDGIIRLQGTVENRQTKRLIEKIVERCPGALDVKNELSVSSTTNIASGNSSGTQTESKSDKSSRSSSRSNLQ